MPGARPVHAGRLRGERPDAFTELGDRALDLVGHEAGERGVERGEVVRRRVGAVLVDRLVARRAGVADVHPGELPDDPVGGLDPVLGASIEVGVLLEQLQSLGELPLRGDLAAVAGEPRLPPLGGEGVDAVGVRLGGVVLPELDVGVRPVGELGHLAQRGAVVEHREHGAGGEVGPDPDDVARVDPAGAHGLRHRVLEHLDVIVRDLQRPVGRQLRAGRAADVQAPLEHAVAIVVHRAPDLGPVGDPDDDGATRQRAEVDADDVLVPLAHVVVLLCRHDRRLRSHVVLSACHSPEWPSVISVAARALAAYA